MPWPPVPLVFRTVLAVLSLAPLAARAEFVADAHRPLAPLLGFSSTVRVAATESGFLAFWSTGSAASGSNYAYNVPAQLQVARLSRDGALERRLAPAEIPPTFTWYDAASNGEEVLLTGICTAEAGKPLCLARFSSAGDFLGLTVVPVGEPVAPTVASNGDGFLVTLSVASTRRALAIPVARDGTAGAPVDLGAWDPYSQWTSPATLGSTYYAAWGTTGDHVLARVSSSGVETSVPLKPPFPISQVRIEGSGERLLVVITPRGASALLAAIFDRDLTRLSDWMFLDGGGALPRLGATSSGWIVAAQRFDDATLLPLSLEGVQGSFAAIPGIRGFVIDAAARGDRAAVVWHEGPEITLPDFHHHRARIAVFGADAAPVRTPSTISVGPAPQIHPAAAHAAGVTMVAWSERTPDGGWRVRARPFDAAGVPLAPTVAMPHQGAPQIRPAVATDGDSFFLAWSEGPGGSSGVYGMRLSPEGTLLDAAPTLLFGATGFWSTWYRTTALAWNGSAWLVVSSNNLGELVAVRVSAGGVLLDAAPRAITTHSEYDYGTNFAPVIDCNGSDCLVVWHGPSVPMTPGCQITCSPPPPGLYAALLDSDLGVTRRMPPLTEPWEDLPSDFRSLDATWNVIAREWLVSWTRHQRITADGTMLVADDAISGHARQVSSIPEREGWRVVWAPSGRSDLFHGWTRTGAIGQIRERYVLAASSEPEWDARAIDAPRPLALFLRERQQTPGAPEVVGRFFDESPAPEDGTLVLSATRLPGGDVRLDWTTDLEDVTGFAWSILRRGEWAGSGLIEPSVRHAFLTPGTMTDVTHIVLGAVTPSGTVFSNVISLLEPRKRLVTR